MIGCVPYLNAKPLINWFHSAECGAPFEVEYAVPSQLALGLAAGRMDAALVSTFELFRNRTLWVAPGISVSADGPVKSVRLFSRVPYEQIRSVALDTSSLTSVALVQIVLAELFAIRPLYAPRRPDLAAMLAEFDAGLIIGDLKLFDVPADHVLDLGEAWKQLTGLPFVYAAWLGTRETLDAALLDALAEARAWGTANLDQIARNAAVSMALPLDRVRDYFYEVMEYDLPADKIEAMGVFQQKCFEHHLISAPAPFRFAERSSAAKP